MRVIVVPLLVILIGLLSTASSAAELLPKTAEQIRDLLEVGFERGQHALPAAKALVEPLQKSGDTAPDLAYAYGLVLLKQFKPKEAIGQFRRAADNPDTLHCPAWQALIWTHFSAKETALGYDRVFELAKRLKSAPADQQK